VPTNWQNDTPPKDASSEVRPSSNPPVMGNNSPLRRKVIDIRREGFTFWSRHVLASVASTGYTAFPLRF
jgi:hypothetical protein